MTDQNRQFDEYGRGMPHPCEPVSDRFRKDLRALYQPTGSVPPQVDKAILDQARRQLAKPRRTILRIRWAGGIAAAAAVVALGVFLYHRTGSNNHPSSIINNQSAAAERRADFDGNGRVDILDAFRLARSIESRGPTAGEWDINNDGRIDRDDIDAVAFAAVRLSPVFAGCAPGPLPWQPSQSGKGGATAKLVWLCPSDGQDRSREHSQTKFDRGAQDRRWARTTRPFVAAGVLPEHPMRPLACQAPQDKGV